MIKNFFLISIYLFVPFLINGGSAQNADSSFQNRQFTMAALEYERIIAFSSDKSEINAAHYKKALCYKNLGKHDKAQIELLKISYWDLPADVKMKYNYETVLSCYLAGSFKEAILNIAQMDSTKDSVYESRLLLIKTLSLNESREWNKAHDAACVYITMIYSPEKADSIKQILHQCYAHKKLPHLKKESVANVLKFVPGLEQIYTGEITEGIFSFSINLAFLSFGAYQIYEQYYLTGYFVGAIGLSKVYFGGQTRAAYLLNRKNYHEQRKFCDHIKSIILK